MRIVESQKFKVPAGSKTEAAIFRYREQSENAQKAWDAFAENHNAKQIYASDSLLGLVFEGSKPDGWVKNRRCAIAFRPALTRPLSDAAKEFKSLPSKPSMVDWLRMLGLDIKIIGGSFKSPGFKEIDGQLYLTAKEGCPIPDDVIDC